MTKTQKEYIELKLKDYADQSERLAKKEDRLTQDFADKISSCLIGWVDCLETLGYKVERSDDNRYTVSR